MPAVGSDERSAAHVPDSAEESSGLPELVGSLLATWRELAHRTLSLFALEFKSAGLHLVAMAGMAIVLAFLLATTWLIVLAVIAYWAVELGLEWGNAGLLLIVVNLVCAGALAWAIAHAREKLTFAATRRVLQDV